MRVAVFDSKSYDKLFLTSATDKVEWHYFEPRLTQKTMALAEGNEIVCVFVHDELSRPVLTHLKEHGTRMIALRCAGFNNVDLEAARDLEMPVVRVPAYSPYAVAEHAVAMMLMLNRRLHRAYNRVREGNFSLEGLLGFDMHGKTAGIVGTGKIGEVVAGILKGFGCRVLAYDVRENPVLLDAGAEYVPLEGIWSESDIISLHCPLLPATRHLVDDETVTQMKRGVMLINTSRGELVHTTAVINGLKSGTIGYLGLDVYEEEENLFFRDLSGEVIADDVFARLLTFPNVLVTAHQAFFTRQALAGIAETTASSIHAFQAGEDLTHNIIK